MSEGQKVEPAVSFIHLIKRRELKQRILEAVTKAQGKSPQLVSASAPVAGVPSCEPATGALIVESQRRNFVKSFDAIENCQRREPFDAIEAAFELGKYAALVEIVTEKQVERARQKIRRDAAIQAKKSKADQTEQAVRAVVNSKTTTSLGSAKLISGKLKGKGIDIPPETVRYYLRKAKKEGKL